MEKVQRLNNLRPILLCTGLFYILVYTPIWDLAGTAYIAGLTFLLALFSGYYNEIIFKQRYFLLFIAGFLAVNILLSPLADKASSGLTYIIKGLLIYPLALFTGRMMSEQHFFRLGLGFTVLNSFAALLLVTLVINWNDSFESLELWTKNTVGNLHNLDNVLFISVLLLFTLSLKARTHWHKLAFLIVVLPLAVVIGVAMSEGSFIAMYIAAIVFMALYITGYKRTILILAALLPLALLHLLYFKPELFTQLAGQPHDTLLHRSQIYQQLISAWLEHPWMGWGINTYKYVDQTYVNNAVIMDGVRLIYPHHIYLEGLFSLGIIGMSLVFTWFIWAMSKVRYSQIKQSGLGLFALLALVYICVKGMSDMKFLSQQTIGWLVACIGILHGRTQRPE